MSDKLKGKKIAFLATDGVEQIELTEPWKAIEEAGGKPVLVSLEAGKIQGVHHDEKGDKFDVDEVITNVKADDFSGLVLPGGVFNPDALRMNSDAVSFVKDFFKQHKPVSAICHGPWLLVEAGVVEGRNLTSWPSLETDIRNAGGRWMDAEVVCDQALVTSRNPNDLKAFCEKTVEEMAEGKHAKQVA